MSSAGRIDNIQDIHELTPILQGLLFHSLFEPASGVYIEQVLCEIHGDVDEQHLRQAFAIVVDRHPALRSTFHWQEFKKPLQVVMKHVDVPWQTLDWRHLPDPEQQDRMAAWLRSDRVQPIQLDQAPIFRCTLLRLSPRRYRLAWTYHHLLIDGWSLSIVLHQLFTGYRALQTGNQPSTNPAPPFRDYVIWQQTQPTTAAPPFWRNYLAGITTATRVTTGAPTTTRVGKHLTATTVMNGESTWQVEDFARRHRITTNSVVAGAVAILLAQHSDRLDVLFGSTVSGRPAELPGSQDMVGVFINALPLRARIDTDAEPGPWMQQLQVQLLDRDHHAQDSLVEIQGWSDVPRGSALFELLLVYENYPWPDDLGDDDLTISDVRALEQTNYPLTVVVTPGDQLTIRADWYDISCDSTHVRGLMKHLGDMLAVIGSPDHRRIGDLPRLPGAPISTTPQRQTPPRTRGAAPGRNVLSPLERDLADIWHEVLGTGPTGPDGNFFDLGGHSLNATQVISRIQQRLRVDVSLRELFDTPTIGELAEVVAARLGQPHPAPRRGDRVAPEQLSSRRARQH